MRIFFFSVLLLIFLFACQNGESKKQESEKPIADLKTALPGIWQSVSIRVNVNSVDNMDSSYVFEVQEENWIRDLGIKPIRTYYEPDNKYRSEYRSSNDTLTNVTRGIWNVFGDTLMLITPQFTYQYQVKIKNGLGEFRSLLDWDGDGKEDDEYFGIQRYVSRATN